MRNLLAVSLAVGALSFALGGMALADADPTVHQIYEAASSGHLDQAQHMMDEVLRDHPKSAKAHYVQSELYAREGKFSLARTELERAEQLEPGLPRENPRSVAELKSELGLIRRADRPIGATKESAPHFPWVTVLILALVVGIFWMLFRRRTTSVPYPPGMPTTTPGAGPAGYGPGGPVGGGIGSTVAGGLAGGLAAGAGIVAGEALAHQLLEGGHSSAPPGPSADNSESNAVNSDMGGADFGVNDPGSWDDGSGGGGGDWT
ncbi:MAG TPA: hypothetical protein VNZ53_23885 [Steroidobacteraceae bacterium]|jgi:tetratricopeptide (TPR) repeat protein|nr:hypothetical protein [Steroidobacteraceae bacterium]